jgi:hypothetical protein
LSLLLCRGSSTRTLEGLGSESKETLSHQALGKIPTSSCFIRMGSISRMCRYLSVVSILITTTSCTPAEPLRYLPLGSKLSQACRSCPSQGDMTIERFSENYENRIALSLSKVQRGWKAFEMARSSLFNSTRQRPLLSCYQWRCCLARGLCPTSLLLYQSRVSRRLHSISF